MQIYKIAAFTPIDLVFSCSIFQFTAMLQHNIEIESINSNTASFILCIKIFVLRHPRYEVSYRLQECRYQCLLLRGVTMVV